MKPDSGNLENISELISVVNNINYLHTNIEYMTIRCFLA